MKLLSSAQIKEWDQFTVENEPITSIDLMERASQNFVHWFVSIFKDTNIPVDIFCGNGNNGGDGLAIARLLRDRFYNVKVYILRFAKEDSVDFDINLSRLLNCGDIDILFLHETKPELNTSSIIIDALMGTGVSKAASGHLKDTIDYINKHDNIVISVDLPSGLPSEGEAFGPAISSDYVYTFQLPKLSFFFQQNEKFCPHWSVGTIGLHSDFLNQTKTSYILTDLELIKSMYKKRSRFAHKGNFGHAMIVAGSEQKTGASILATKACLRSGAGLVTTYIDKQLQSLVINAIPEAMVMTPVENFMEYMHVDFAAYTLGIGPGLGTDIMALKKIKQVLQNRKSPVVLDADAITMIANEPAIWDIVPQSSILTPHPKEFERLFGKTNTESERLKLARSKAEHHHMVIVLKGAFTRIFTPEGLEYINSTGNPGMATAGSGDVLTGIITGLLAQGYAPEQAAVFGVFLHGLAGDMALKQQSPESLIAGDIIGNLGDAFRMIG